MTQVYIYRWNRMGRKGQRCIVLCRGTMNSCMVEFEDGYRAVTSRNAIRKVKGTMKDVPEVELLGEKIVIVSEEGRISLDIRSARALAEIITSSVDLIENNAREAADKKG